MYLGYELQTEKLFTEFHGNTVPVLSMKPDDTNQLKYRQLWKNIICCCKTPLKSIQLIQNTSSMLTGKEILFLSYCFLFLVLPLSTITDLLVLLFFIISVMYTLIYTDMIYLSAYIQVIASVCWRKLMNQSMLQHLPNMVEVETLLWHLCIAASGTKSLLYIDYVTADRRSPHSLLRLSQN